MNESKPKFTPGPWEVFAEDGTTNWHTIVIRRREPQNGIEQLPVDICSCQNCLYDALEKPANAALIAAAPEMYELLDRIKGRLEFCKLENSIDAETEREIDALLRKARGEA